MYLPGLSSFAAPLPGADKDTGPVRLSSNENPYGPSPLARAAMADSIGSSNRYPWKMISELKTELGSRSGLKEENVLVGAGSTQILDALVQLAALQKGSFVLAEPTFSRWKGAAQSAGLQKIAVPLTPDKRHDLDAMLRAIRPDTRMLYICNPNNPTGTICAQDALAAAIREACSKTLVVVDEAYLDYTQEPSLSHLIAGNEKLIVVKTFSKIYGLAGARIGYALGHAKTIERLGGLQSGSDMGISAVSLAGALAALKDKGFVKESYSLNEQARAYTAAQLTRLHIDCIPSHTNFIYFSLARYKKDFFALLKANSIQGTGIFEEDGKWSRITVGKLTEMQQFIRAIS